MTVYFMSRESFGQDQRISYRHNIFMSQQSWPSQEFSVTTEYFMSWQSVVKWKGFVLRQSNSMSRHS